MKYEGMNSRWVLRTPITGHDPFLKKDYWAHNYIIRLCKDNTFTVYEAMKGQHSPDFDYFSYGKIKNLKSLSSAKKLCNYLYKNK